MKSMRGILILCSVVTLCLCPSARAEIKVTDFLNPAKVIGRLGKPLGTRMVIEGVQEEAMVRNPLKVSRVDGATLKNPVVIQIRGNVEVQKGTRYRFEGYESGEFAGPPDWLQQAQQPFQFYSFFVVTKVIEPTPK